MTMLSHTSSSPLAVVKVADHMITPMGQGTRINFLTVQEGTGSLMRHKGTGCTEEDFVASLLFPMQWEVLAGEGRLTRFERLVTTSVRSAADQVNLDLSRPDVRLIISTTKGNVELLGDTTGHFPQERVLLSVTAKVIAHELGVTTPPVVVSNACISGLSAQLTAQRMLQAGLCSYAVVVGADVISPFIVTGFQSFHALSAEPCKPFDAARNGLNLGEAVATIIYKACEEPDDTPQWQLVKGASHNDANHISGPSRTAEGCYRSLMDVLPASENERNALALIGVHGTATPYNDEMEALAIHRAGLSHLPVCALKGYYGHTLGAAGVLETALTMKFLDQGYIPGSKGFTTLGVTHPVNLSAANRPTERKSFIKMLSGFGGCNAAMYFVKQPIHPCQSTETTEMKGVSE